MIPKYHTTASPPLMHESAQAQSRSASFDPASVTRPDPSLMTYYVIVSLLTVFGFPFVIWPLLFKYRTLKYAFDDKGVSMSYGLLFRKEVYLTYRRIQDIQVTRNLIHRWLGLSAVAVQTASGSSSAEMTIEGITNPEGLRDYLYLQMRGAKGDSSIDAIANESSGGKLQSQTDEALALLLEIRDELRSMRGNRKLEGPAA